MKKPFLTLDTSCVISLLRQPEDSTPYNELEALEQIQQWNIDNKIEISISEKSRTEAIFNIDKAVQIDPQNHSRFNKWLNTLNILDNYKTVNSRWILGISRLGVDTVLGSEHEKEEYNKISRFLFGKSPENLNEGDAFDLVILFEHYIHGNDFFITRDLKNNMLKKKSELKQNWNIIVYDPIEAVKILRISLDLE